ncbi:MAG: aminoacyl-tRNA hydrolase [Candidatus Magasanikbacteria bacterium CG11_big_fil_rev_8_21_14_0_20_43_7]|uniref:Peptidyl-tRNA hydrolase n=1 Tax=Candidatus Magasanikbacteria bacterium CG11_big_fil_rev_8_21_14_0_20_43_7 TaxID=1974654 RepID=A0A2H0N3K4_9BACT|nr:MAG: aminoacyl-tRNA hydrolase [Candidatus Magasanikbacteria bacterium CG11_big_fil_rev_8_21_14_0_20_43_7]
MKLIVGLGNPGKQYEKTRHNAGFLLLDMLREHYGCNTWSLSKKCNSEIAEGMINEQKILLAKPMTFVNNSGQAVGLISQFYKLKPIDILVVHDDKDITLGEIKFQTDRGHAGHNGIRSIIEHLGTQNFSRIRVGIAPEEKERMKETADYVLGKFGMFERRTLKAVGENIQKDIGQWISSNT